MRWLLLIATFLFTFFVTASLIFIYEQQNEMNQEIFDLAVSYDALAFNLTANIPGCD